MNRDRRQIVARSFSLLMAAIVVHSAHAQERYRRVDKANLGGTSLQDSILLSPRKLVLTFGDPTPELWDSESLGAFYFEPGDGRVLALYRRAYDRADINQLRVSFWREIAEVEFSIGAVSSSGLEDFKEWLVQRVRVHAG
jgi:hypothetical protein